MPLQIVSDTLDLPDAVVRVSKFPFVFAETVNLFDMTLLLTYRSTAVRDDDPAYEDVAHLLERAGKVEKIFEETIPDDLMFFGEATWTVHLLHSGEEIKAPTDPRVQRMVDLIMRWDYAAHPAYLPDRIREQLSMGVA
ncbi:hypothetical protein SEA_POCAHONTAS_71 [Mycobacterium phage Pocahontas]|uniref:Uncharacterized protein n=1 Tax=Mycobacterium phage Veracruz TaxID=2530154 RepID=A0A481VTK2_9CAUD|nr:hypothetical protein KIP27_gp23 [Mycobacterium phage Veracruz]AIS73745.1 hypothetical protein PBI_QUINNKIRO_71 [Mycobacterium phage QuinnKiro]ALA11873.1 hypothetical protein SEA_TEXAGE_70 [Mycobacterium phage Texage]AOT24220.1 hypothetical protein SEA_TODACORO_72 [Mycobacterium phage Todacoro]AOT25573.1 hypothetical protein SEA_MARGO_72 [Mycobacterium phage Margo]AUX82367.1 hypothetical protein SEA_LAMBERT1_72 [Mycobacterium phage Lambert1]AYR03450.1 hypothetical protein SEA_POPCICLE_72 [M